ncbi:RecQ family ATP-dependent DNA helicase [Vagococcus lutrae]|uniref:RecQ family ATP-dependent DNA helicase n=1 Tax=Vagococcus lutrae TaxID=81947 RepID=UPI00200FC82F|nr:RecQ family ATP-dependent DNA helicase [Vagococcus lutrae]UQF12154.1 RecQ family ATP-dependent DNA helicase [Vagococcus lutrae]
MKDLQSALSHYFGYQDFRKGQRETIQAVMQQRNVLAILPTGTGKSLCYQLPTLLLDGLTVVVSPLIALMDDQVQSLKQKGVFSAVTYNSSLDFNEKRALLSSLSQQKFLFISPESLATSAVIEALQRCSISLFVVDEAHCISEWGLDFRPEYEQIPQIVAQLTIKKCLALSATATAAVQQDIEQKLFLNEEVKVIRYSVDRPNITYSVVTCTTKNEKEDFIDSFLARHTSQQGILYFSSKAEAVRISDWLRHERHQSSAFYHSDLSHQDRRLIQEQFLKGDVRILCATSAFGMGIDKSDIRFVIHFHLPSSLEALVQESGRAGRDGKLAHSIVLYQPADWHIHRHLASESLAEYRDFKARMESAQKDVQSFTDLQKTWYDHYQQGWLSLSRLEKMWEKKLQQRERQATIMRRWLEMTNCRRLGIHHYFESGMFPAPIKNEHCCDNCQLDIWQTRLPETEKVESHDSTEWQTVLKKLFNVGYSSQNIVK